MLAEVVLRRHRLAIVSTFCRLCKALVPLAVGRTRSHVVVKSVLNYLVLDSKSLLNLRLQSTVPSGNLQLADSQSVILGTQDLNVFLLIFGRTNKNSLNSCSATWPSLKLLTQVHNAHIMWMRGKERKKGSGVGSGITVSSWYQLVQHHCTS